ncbi:MAG: hypothetical protein D6732_19435 [Methanobacteriota archaeon]|nr:MAG: hypothetical protein D6732_19435 [Euryarchaeota archaeon]
MSHLTAVYVIAGFSIVGLFVLSRLIQLTVKRGIVSREMANIAFIAPVSFIVADVIIEQFQDMGFFATAETLSFLIKYSIFGLVFVIYVFFLSDFDFINRSTKIVSQNLSSLSDLQNEPLNWMGYYNKGEFKDIRNATLKLELTMSQMKDAYNLNAKRLVKAVDQIKTILNSLSNYYFTLNKLNNDLIDGLKNNNVFWNQISSTLRHQNKSLIESIEQMKETTKLVEYLNDQINLVAINAAIEAAQAGDRGEGFILVADNIHNLSVQSRESANTLNENIKRLSSEILIDQRELLEKTNKITTFLKEIDSLTKTIGQEIETSIAYLDEVDKSIDQIIDIEGELKTL